MDVNENTNQQESLLDQHLRRVHDQDVRREVVSAYNRERKLLSEMAKRSIDPSSSEGERFRDRFLWTGTEENAALAELAVIENRDRSIVTAASRGLEASVMYKRLTDQQYRDQGKVNADPDTFLILHARLYVAGTMAERARQRREVRP